MRIKVMFSIEEWLVKEIKKLAIDKNKDYSDVVEKALSDYLKEEKTKKE